MVWPQAAKGFSITKAVMSIEQPVFQLLEPSAIAILIAPGRLCCFLLGLKGRCSL
jgi:hypothetical protein